MILGRLDVGGFGRLAGRRFDFTAGLNVVYGPNESGKSTLAAAIVATLYGLERQKAAWRPWGAERFATSLVYRLADGREIEVQRDFERDAKGLRVYDRDGNEISGRLGGHRVGPGEAHLGIPLDVFLNASCVKQQALAIDEGRDAAPLAAHLARALDGGPRDDAALGAIARLDDALRAHVGTEKARKNTPLRDLRARAEQQQRAAESARAQVAALDDLRDRTERAAHDCERLAMAAAEIERRGRSLRAGSIAKRLANLHEFRAELAEMGAEHAAYADVTDFPPGADHLIEQAYAVWETAEAAAAAAAADEAVDALNSAECDALAERRRDVGTIDDATFAQLARVAERVVVQRSATDAAGRNDSEAPTRFAPLVTALAVVALCVAIGCAIAHSWTPTGLAALIALVGFLALLSDGRGALRGKRAVAEARRSAADRLAADEREIARVLAPLGIETFAALAARRAELRDLLGRERNAARTAQRAQAARAAADAAAVRFDELADAVVGDQPADRRARRDAARLRGARRRERDGIAAHLHALEIRRSTILGGDDELALELELADLQRSGVDPIDAAPGALRALEAERASTAEALRAARHAFASNSGEIIALQAQIPDLAELDERLAQTHAEIARLERFERAVCLARTTIEHRTHEAHAAFARRLERSAATMLRDITGGRYAELFVDAATLTIRVRVPETQAIASLERLSAGTRDQAYLVVRLAMARVFSEGLETPPLLLDDPFAFWDTARIERCLPILERAGLDGQAVLFTASEELAAAAALRGASRIDLVAPAQPFLSPDTDCVRSTAMRI